MFCGKCGKPNADDLRFCVYCGADLGSQTPGRGGDMLDSAPTRIGPAPPAFEADTLDLAKTIDGAQVCEGRFLAARYKVQRRLGSGGMGEVWQALDTELDNLPVAIKVLPVVLARNAHSIKALKREAAVALKLTHPNICRLHTFHSDGDVKFLVMEYIDGHTLEELLDEKPDRRMTLAELLPIATQIAAALDYAHGLKPPVLHRDIKPSNIMVTREGAAKLLDFGIAREMKDSVTRVTGRETSGTLLYMSPEQFQGRTPTPASDIYSLAATLYECLGGHPPFYQGSIGHQLLYMEPATLKGVPAAVNAAVLAGLAKVPNERPAQASMFVNRLRTLDEPATRPAAAPPRSVEPPAPPSPPRAERPRELKSGSAPPATPARPAAAPPSIHAAAPPPAGRKSGSGVRGLVVLLVFAICGGIVYLVVSQGTQPVEPPRPPPATAPAPAPAPVAHATTPKPEPARAAGTSPRGSATVYTAWPFNAQEARRRQEETARALGLPVTRTLDLGGGVQMELVLIPAGEFMMGSPASEAQRDADEGPRRTVRISRPFYLARTEVTQGQWKAVMGSSNNPSSFKGDNLPVERISWHDAQEFCRKLSAKAGVTVRLPTEAEWEYACRAGTATRFSFGDLSERATSRATSRRAGTTTRFSFGDSDSNLGNYAWYAGNSGGTTHPVGQKQPNSWGLYDMHGNLWEWCQDLYGAYAAGSVTDPTGAGSGSARLLRGGGWLNGAYNCRAAIRSGTTPDLRYNYLGFRVAVGTE